MALPPVSWAISEYYRDPRTIIKYYKVLWIIVPLLPCQYCPHPCNATHCPDHTTLHQLEALIIPSHFKDSLANYNLKHRISKKNFETKAKEKDAI